MTGLSHAPVIQPNSLYGLKVLETVIHWWLIDEEKNGPNRYLFIAYIAAIFTLQLGCSLTFSQRLRLEKQPDGIVHSWPIFRQGINLSYTPSMP
jgi:hypothetical protein